MKKLFFAIIALMQLAVLTAANPVRVTISDGISNATVKKKMEDNLSRMLTEINAAHEAKRTVNCKGLGLSDDVTDAFELLWENSPFVCTDEAIVEHCLTTSSGYQIRNIPLEMDPEEGSESDDNYQEAVVSFTKTGDISSFYIAIDMNLYMKVVKAKNGDQIDLRRRQLILDYVEQFRTSYNQKDIKFLTQIFSDDALIITGKVIKQKPRDGIKLPDRIEYKKQTKKEYLTGLQRAFNNGKRIHVTFDEIEVVRHPTNVDYYGVTLRQGWTQSNYSDVGYVFLLWDFTDEDAPQIHVRTWQPDEFDSTGKGKQPISKEDIFSLSDFEI